MSSPVMANVSDSGASTESIVTIDKWSDLEEGVGDVKQIVTTNQVITSLEFVIVIALVVTVLVIWLRLYKRFQSFRIGNPDTDPIVTNSSNSLKANPKGRQNIVRTYDMSDHPFMTDVNDTICELNGRSNDSRSRQRPIDRRTYRKSFTSRKSGDNLESIPESEEHSPIRHRKDEELDLEDERSSDCSQFSEVLSKIDIIIDKTFDSMIEDITSLSPESLQYHYSSDSEWFNHLLVIRFQLSKKIIFQY